MDRRSLLISGLAALSLSKAKTVFGSQISPNQSKKLIRGFVTPYRAIPKRHFLPKNMAELQTALATSLESKQDFRVQSSGHCLAGFSQSRTDLIDLRKLNSVKFSADKSTLTVGPAATIQQINNTLGRQKRLLPLGTCPSVAMGGLVTGGGIGALTRQLGLTCDYLIKAELLDARGRLLKVSSKENADLFWAIRGGGGSSFGILTSFTFRTIKTPPARFARYFVRGTIPEMRAWMVNIQDLTKRYPKTADFLIRLNSAKGGQIKAELDITTLLDAESFKSLNQAILGLGLQIKSPVTLQNNFSKITATLFPKSVKNTSLLFSGAFIARAPSQAMWTKAFENMLHNPNEQRSMIMHFLGGAVAEYGARSTAFVHRKAYGILQYGTATKHRSNYHDGFKTLNSLRSPFRQIESGAYVNYPSQDQKNYMQSYWGANLSRLKQIKRKYDPQNMFQHPHSIKS